MRIVSNPTHADGTLPTTQRNRPRRCWYNSASRHSLSLYARQPRWERAVPCPPAASSTGYNASKSRRQPRGSTARAAQSRPSHSWRSRTAAGLCATSSWCVGRKGPGGCEWPHTAAPQTPLPVHLVTQMPTVPRLCPVPTGCPRAPHAAVRPVHGGHPCAAVAAAAAGQQRSGVRGGARGPAGGGGGHGC